MRLVFLNQYYPPDAAPTGVMLEDLVQGLLAEGHEVSVICASGGYADTHAAGSQLGDGGPGSDRGSGASAAAADHRSAISNPVARIIRIGATRFGRGTFIGKFSDYGSYYVGTAWRLLRLRPGPERIVAMTTPPYLSVLARVISKFRGADHAHWVMDLYPEVMAAHGILSGTGRFYRILAGLSRWGFGGRRCAAVLTLGPDMAERVAARVAGCPSAAGRVRWVPLWVPAARGNRDDGGAGRGGPPHRDAADPVLALRRHRGWADGDLIVMYSGNLGLGHRFGEILAAAKGARARQCWMEEGEDVEHRTDEGEGEIRNLKIEIRNDSEEENALFHHSKSKIKNPKSSSPGTMRFVFFGGGKRRLEVEEFARDHPDCALEVHDYAPADQLPVHLQSADVHLVSLDSAWTGTMVPSKLQGIFGAGRPVIFIGSAESSIGRWVNASGGGWVLEPGDVSGLTAALAEARDPQVRATRGRAALAFAAEHFDRRSNVARVAEVLGGAY